MRFNFFTRVRPKQTGGGAIVANVKSPAKARATAHVRRFTGEFECGCVCHPERIAKAVEKGYAAEVVKCEEHGAEPKYIEGETIDCNVAQEVAA